MKKTSIVIISIIGLFLIFIGLIIILNTNLKKDSSLDQEEQTEMMEEKEKQYQLIEHTIERDELCEYMKKIYYEKHSEDIKVDYCQVLINGDTYQYEIVLEQSENIENVLVSIDREELLNLILEEKGPLGEDLDITN